MSFLTLWHVVFIFARSTASKHRSVNLALETVLQFDKPEDINLINKVQDFLSQIQVILNKKQQTNDNDTTRRNKKYKFTDFVEDVMTVVKSFKGDDLKEVIRIVDEDLNTRKVNNDLIDHNTRRLLSRKLTEIRNKPVSIRNRLDAILRELRADKNKRSSYILDFVNTLYKRNSERKLSKLIKRLNLFKRSARKSKVVLKSIIEKIINDVIYEHYNNLENNERRYIKKFVKVYLKDEISTTKEIKINQRAKGTEIQENINTDENKAAVRLIASESNSETFKDVPKTTMKKIFTHITLYPKTIKLKKIHKFRTGFPTVNNTPEVLTDEENIENTKDKSEEEESKETKEILTNHSVEINVNLMFKRSPDAEEPKDIQTIESFRAKYTPNKTFPSELKIKSRKNKNYQKSSTTPLSAETFGSLHKIKTPKKYNHKKIPRLITYNDKTITKDEYFKTSYDDNIKQTRDKFYVDHRRVNKQTNLNEDKITESHIKDVETTTHSVTRASMLSITSSNKSITPATTHKFTIETASDVLNEIFGNESLIELKEVTENIPQERVSTNQEFITKDNVTKFENDSIKHINNITESEVSPIAFDVDNYVKNSEILNFDDEEKKKQIEEKMKADLNNLLESSSTTAPTEDFTDIFKELEDAFQI